jgi:hypothetical protein
MSGLPGRVLEPGALLSDRYEIGRCLGQGAVGVVFEAFDRVRGARVALKTMRRLRAADLYRFKREFRALADVAHPNLATLHELEGDGDLTFFTMEVIDGVDFLRWVTGDEPSTDGMSPARLDRLRPALLQLVDGLAALHAHGKLHRDVKPSNVMVTTEGRVVILDFGLVASFGAAGAAITDDNVVGTPDYMSPEQAASTKLTEATDWYSVGVMLHQALFGGLPFVGPLLKVLVDKQLFDAPPPPQLPGVPDDLRALAIDLLRREPGQRPTAEDIRRRIAGSPVVERASAADVDVQAVATPAGTFVGRARHMSTLAAALEATRSGRTVVALVRGSSGMGKSLLASRFLDGLAREGGSPVVLSARCYERESVPYKALDAIVDALSEHLRRLPFVEVDAVLPVEIRALTRLFPVLDRVEAIASVRSTHRAIADLQELRRRAATALRELLTRMARRRMLVLWIDDLQWADVDSAALIEEVLRPPGAPPLLLLASYRSEDPPSAFVTALQRIHAAGRGELEVRELDVGTLEPSEARELALSLLGNHGGAEAHADAIAAESGGSPFLVDVLVQHLGTERTMDVATGTLRLDDVLHERAMALPAGARRLLEIVSIAGNPVARAVAEAAAGLEGDDAVAALALVRARKLVRSLTSRDQLATYHDRMREVVVARLDEAARARAHLALARALVAAGGADPEALVVHFGAGGERTKAAEAAAVAAARAVDALAFDQATTLWRRALDLPGITPDARRDLQSRLAEALTNDGRDAEAAEVRLENARGEPTLEALELRRRAAEQFLVSGHFERGYALLRAVLADVGERFPTSPLAVVFWVLVSRLMLRFRGVAFDERRSTMLDRTALVRIDSLGSAGAGFAMTDNIRGAYFQTKNLLLALDAGDARRIARSLALEVCFTSAGGSPRRARTFALLGTAREIAERVGTPDALALADLATGYAHYMNGEWRAAKAAFVAAEEGFRDRCIDVNWLLSSARTMLYRTLVLRGDLDELATRLPPVLRTAGDRGDEYAIVNFRAIPMTTLQLAADEREQARTNIDELRGMLPSGVFHIQHYYVLTAALDLDIYAGEPRRGLERLRATSRAMRRSLLLRVETVKLLMLDLRGRCAAAAAAADPAGARPLVASVDAAAAEMRRVDSPWSRATGLVLASCAYALRGDRAATVAELTRADEALTATDMRLRAAAVRRRLGQLAGGDDGAARVAEAEAEMEALGVRNKEAMTRLYTPGVELLLSERR